MIDNVRINSVRPILKYLNWNQNNIKTISFVDIHSVFPEYQIIKTLPDARENLKESKFTIVVL